MIKLTGNLLKEFSAIAQIQSKEVKESLAKQLALNTPVDTGYAASRWKVNSTGQLENDAEYIDKLNEGSSQQAPAYFIEQTLLANKGVHPNGTIVRPMT